MSPPTDVTQLTRADLCALIPHGAPLCMIDAIESCTPEAIVCISHQHAHAAHPLDAQQHLSGLILLEYAAQAVALHAGLSATAGALAAAQPAYVGAVKDVELHDAISDNREPVRIVAECQLAAANGAIYAVSVYCRDALIVSGRLILSQP